MRILLFCENKYAVDILQPIQTEAKETTMCCGMYTKKRYQIFH